MLQSFFGIPNFHPGVEYRYAMSLAASLMLGWTVLLLWAERRPVERRGILLITLFPVLLGLIAAGIYAVVAGMVHLDKMLPTFAMQGALFIFDTVVLILTHN